MPAENEREDAIEIEVVPFDQCADGRSCNDPRQPHRPCRDTTADGLYGRRHHLSPKRLFPSRYYTQTTVTFKCADLGFPGILPMITVAAAWRRGRARRRRERGNAAPPDDRRDRYWRGCDSRLQPRLVLARYVRGHGPTQPFPPTKPWQKNRRARRIPLWGSLGRGSGHARGCRQRQGRA